MRWKAERGVVGGVAAAVLILGGCSPGDPASTDSTASRRDRFVFGGQNVVVTGTSGQLGTDLAVDGVTAIVGNVPGGAARAYAWDGAVWNNEPGLLLRSNSVSIDGDTTVQCSSVNLLAESTTRTAGVWNTEQMFSPADMTPVEEFGIDCFVSGDTAVVGDGLNDTAAVDAGAAYVFTRSGTTWTEQATLTASDASMNGQFGYPVSIDGGTILVGARNSSQAYVFVGSGATWVEEAILTIPDPVTEASAVVRGDTAIVGVKDAMVGGVAAGKAHVFVRSGGTWSYEGALVPDDSSPGMEFGFVVDLRGDTALVGAPFDDQSAINGGAAYVFVRYQGTWTQRQKLTALFPENDAEFGHSLGIGAGVAAVGAWKANNLADTVDLAGEIDGFVLTPLLVDGTACSTGNACRSGLCVDGVCCESACAGSCESCLDAETGAGDGVCAPVTAGTDPGGDCADDGSPACTQNGLCDGAGACQMYPSASGCTPEPCAAGSDCASGVCADGICCDTDCSSPCVACTAAKKGAGIDGICEAVAADTDPDDGCPEDPGFPASCGADGLCDGMGNCRGFATPMTQCGATACNGNVVTGQLCDGAGTCQMNSMADCAPYVCEGSACTDSCSVDADCHSTGFCTAAGTCATKMPSGDSCGRKEECASGICVDGYCCNDACGGQCEACDAAGAEGVCSAITGAPRGGRPDCPAGTPDQPCTAASCDGADRTQCARFVGPEVECGPASCSDGVATLRETCDGTGACSTTDPVDCAPYACDGDACGTAPCADDSDCDDQFRCDDVSQECVARDASFCRGEFTLVDPNGVEQSCEPYRCEGSACVASCAATSDCSSGFICDDSECVPSRGQGSDAGDDGGCGCRVAAQGAPSAAAFSMLLALAGLVRARRRSRPRR